MIALYNVHYNAANSLLKNNYQHLAEILKNNRFQRLAIVDNVRQTLCSEMLLEVSHIKTDSFIILAVLRRSVPRVFRAHFMVNALVQDSFFQRNVAVVSSRWQRCLRFDQPEI